MPEGRPYRYDSRERVVAINVVADTPANRRQLRMHGPTR